MEVPKEVERLKKVKTMKLQNMSMVEKVLTLKDLAKGGQNIVATFQSFPKLKVEYNGRVKKVSHALISMNKNYRNLKVNEGRTDFKGLNEGEKYVINNVLIEKVKDNETSYLVRCYPGTLKNVKTETQYYLDNEPITKQELIERGIIKDKPHTEVPCFNVKLENLLELGKEEE